MSSYIGLGDLYWNPPMGKPFTENSLWGFQRKCEKSTDDHCFWDAKGLIIFVFRDSQQWILLQQYTNS